MPRMGKTEEHWNGLKLGFLKTVQPNSFSKLIPIACKNNAQETYLFVTDLWFCHLYVIFFAYFKFHSDWGRVTGKIEQNELNCRDTAPLIRLGKMNGHSAVFLHQLSVGRVAKINRKIPICFIIFKVKFTTIKLNVDKNSSFNSVAQK